MPWLTILLFLLGGLVGYGARRPRPLLGALLVNLVVLAIAHDQGVHWLILAFSLLLPVLAAACVTAFLRQWYLRSRFALRGRANA